MSRSSTARLAAAVTGVLAFLAGAASLRRRRLRRGGSMDVKEIARRLIEEPWRGKLDEVLELVGEDAVAHVAGSPAPLTGKDGFRDFVTTYLTAFPDGTITVDDQIAEGDIVVSRWTGRGTNTGELMGIRPTGRQVTIEGISYAGFCLTKKRETCIPRDSAEQLHHRAP